MYKSKTSLILAFHGCDESVRNKLILNQDAFKKSEKPYDWLGHGIYFWENNSSRAYKWACYLKDNPKKNSTKIEIPSVLGAVIDLGYCFDLLDNDYLEILKEGYKSYKTSHEIAGLPLPKNSSIKKEKDLLLRHLDCAVIEYIHHYNKKNNQRDFDSVRAVFWEGKNLYPQAGFKEKNHIQICIRNPNCIKGLFIPRILNKDFDLV